jgi:hypothetical protein
VPLQPTELHQQWLAALVDYLDHGKELTTPKAVPGTAATLSLSSHRWSRGRGSGVVMGGEGGGGAMSWGVPGRVCVCGGVIGAACTLRLYCCPRAPGRPGLSAPIRMFWYAAPFVFSPAHAGTEWVTTHRVLKFDRMCREAMKAIGVPIVDATAVTQSMWEAAYDGLHYLRGSNDNWNGHVSNMVFQVGARVCVRLNGLEGGRAVARASSVLCGCAGVERSTLLRSALLCVLDFPFALRQIFLNAIFPTCGGDAVRSSESATAAAAPPPAPAVAPSSPSPAPTPKAATPPATVPPPVPARKGDTQVGPGACATTSSLDALHIGSSSSVLTIEGVKYDVRFPQAVEHCSKVSVRVAKHGGGAVPAGVADAIVVTMAFWTSTVAVGVGSPCTAQTLAEESTCRRLHRRLLLRETPDGLEASVTLDTSASHYAFFAEVWILALRCRFCKAPPPPLPTPPHPSWRRGRLRAGVSQPSYTHIHKHAHTHRGGCSHRVGCLRCWCALCSVQP